MSNIINIDTITTQDIPVKKILMEAAKRPELDEVLVIGYDVDGSLYIASSTSDISITNLMLDKCKTELLRMADNE